MAASNGKMGVAFPTDEKGARSTTAVAKVIWAASVQGLDDSIGERVRGEKDWRHKYTQHLSAIGDLACQSKINALTIARQGLDAVYSAFEFERDGQSTKFSEAMESLREGSFNTGKVEGSDQGSAPAPEMPYKGETLTGEALKAKIQQWADRGTVEGSVAVSVSSVVDDPKMMDLSGKFFVLLGAGSELGPLNTLLKCGATVVAIRTRKAHAWKESIDFAKTTRGTLLFPVKEGEEPEHERAGCDVLTEAPEIRNWLLNVLPEGADVTVGLYIYLDSDAHVRASVACDAIMNELSEKRNAAFAYLGSPSVDCLLPDGARAAMDKNRAESSWWLRATGAPMPPVSEVQGENGQPAHVCHGFVVAQGPNYALAKTLQNWRAMLAREAGVVVSSTIGPPSRTYSVMHNKTMKVMLDSMGYMAPNETFDAPTAAALLSILLIEDLQNKSSIAHPTTPLAHPWGLFSDKAAHGGCWRTGYDVEGSTALSVVLYGAGTVAPVK